MKWFKKVTTPPPLPTVPDDLEERKKLIEKSTADLEVIKGRSERIRAVAETTSRHLTRNHYIERLENSYGLSRSE